MLKDVFKNKREFLKYEIIAIDSAGNLNVNKSSGIKWDNRADAENELKDWFRNDAQNSEGLLDENSVKVQGRDGIIYSEADIAKMDNFVGVEYVFPEDFDRYSIGNYTYQIEEVDDDK